MTTAEALSVIGMPRHFRVTGRDAVREVHSAWKVKVVAARNNGHDGEAARLSEAWNKVRSVGRKWCECGNPKKEDAINCQACGQARKHAPRLPVLTGGKSLREIVDAAIVDAVARLGTPLKAASELQISRQTIYTRLRQINERNRILNTN